MHKHRILVGLFMVASHFVVLSAVIALWANHGFLFEEMTTTIGLIGPLFAGYTTVVIAYVIDNPHVLKDEGDKLSLAFRLLSFCIPFVFVCVVLAAVLLWAYKVGFTEFGQFKSLVGLIEGGFGIYVGQFIYSMFKRPAGLQKQEGVPNTI